MGGKHHAPWRLRLRRRLITVRRRMAVTCPVALVVFMATATSAMHSLADIPPEAAISADGRSVGTPSDDDPDLTLELAQEAVDGARNPQSTGQGRSVSHARAIGINVVVLEAHRRAETAMARTRPGCHLSWTLLAAIGEVESHNARSRNVSTVGNVRPPILGPVLNGERFASISDSDGGRWDGDSRWDRAVGPMQFIPGTWARHGTDGNGDGVADPNNVFDASLSSGGYLCFGGRNLATPNALSAAIYSYNHSWSYVRTVLSWMQAYASGAARPVANPNRSSGNPAPTVPTPTPRPSPTPRPTPTPAPSPTPSTSPSASPTPTPSPTCSASPSPSPSGSASPSPSPSGSASPSPSPSGSPSPSPSPTPPCEP